MFFVYMLCAVSLFAGDYSIEGEGTYSTAFAKLRIYRPVGVTGSSEILNTKRSFFLYAKSYDELVQQLRDNLKADGYSLTVSGGRYVILPLPADVGFSRVQPAFSPPVTPAILTAPKEPKKIKAVLPSGKIIYALDSSEIVSQKYSDSISVKNSFDSSRYVSYLCTVTGVRSVRLRSGGLTLSDPLFTYSGDVSLTSLKKGVQVAGVGVGVSADRDTLDFYHTAQISGLYGDSLSVTIGDEKRRASSTVTTQTSVTSSFETYYNGLQLRINRGRVRVEYRLGDMVFTGSGSVGSPVIVSGTVNGRGRGLFKWRKTNDLLKITCEVLDVSNGSK